MKVDADFQKPVGNGKGYSEQSNSPSSCPCEFGSSSNYALSGFPD